MCTHKMEESGAIAGIAPDHYDYNAPVGVYCKTCAVQCREDGATSGLAQCVGFIIYIHFAYSMTSGNYRQ